ncbi:MAG: thioredoxin family protein [Chitinophagales bacterium]|nr:thioredoxin family protein [Chitinophagales bacterium]
MKKIFFAFSLLFSSMAFAQNQFETLVERPNEKSLKGIISRQVLLSDSSFKWYAESLKGFTVRTDAREALAAKKDSIRLLVFIGTWCEDSHFIIPKLYATTDAAGFPDSQITLIGVDRNKTTLGNLTETLQVKNVPTIIVLKNGVETGRIVEYGKYGMFDKELAEIIVGSR